MKRIHLIGVGGSGLSAIARLLLERGYSVSGSDIQMTPLALRLQQEGAHIVLGHRPENIHGAEIVVRSSAIREDNPEVRAALAAGIPVLKRAEFLGELMAGKTGIAIAGTHGKTTTTAMISWILTKLGLDPSYLVGGYSFNLMTNAHAGLGDFFVIEADEYDRMFLGLKPQMAVVTNIEHDHPDCYPTEKDFYVAFVEFGRTLPVDGLLIACLDDPGAAKLLHEGGLPDGRRSYGINSQPIGEPDYRGSKIEENDRGGYDYDLSFRGRQLARINLKIPGLHNVRNSLAALAVVHSLNLPIEPAVEALSEYAGASRRFEIRGEFNGVAVVDDYAHHPSEIRATLLAARQRFNNRKIWAIWQPHTYSRTRALFDEFVTAFSDADRVVVTEVFAAREAPDPQFTAEEVVRAMSHPNTRFIPNLPDVIEYLLANLQRGDVLVVLSAGDTEELIRKVMGSLSSTG